MASMTENSTSHAHYKLLVISFIIAGYASKEYLTKSMFRTDTISAANT
jgi:hypothetical protein